MPKLLRRVATEIEKHHIKPMDLLDVTIPQGMTEDGPWQSVIVYWSPSTENESPGDGGVVS
jgi:hypothetical protein